VIASALRGVSLGSTDESQVFRLGICGVLVLLGLVVVLIGA
jgi:hypothetical protein